MSKLTMKDGTELFYKDWGSGPPIVFSHGWPLCSDMWDNQMMVFGRNGYRVVAHDRRGFGRSGQNWDNNTNEQFADDLAELIDHLGLHDVVLVAHSMAGGEVCRFVSRHGCDKLSKLVMVGTVPPLLLKTDGNPDGVPMAQFDEMRDNIQKNRAEFFSQMPKMFLGFNKLLHKTSEPMEHQFWLQAMMAGIKPTYDCVAQFSVVDFSEDLKKITVPTLFIHGDADQVVPLAATSERAAKLVPHAKLQIFNGGSHGIPLTEAEQFNDALQAFITGQEGFSWRKNG